MARAEARTIIVSMKNIAPRIVVDPNIRHGKPVVEGTRVPVATVLSHLAAGWDYPRLMSEFGITHDDVMAVLRYAAQILQDEDTRAVG